MHINHMNTHILPINFEYYAPTSVEDVKKMSDHAGRILPDAFLIPYHADVRYLAKEIHTELEKTMLHAIDARTGLRLPTDYILKDRDVISIIAAARKKRT